MTNLVNYLYPAGEMRLNRAVMPHKPAPSALSAPPAPATRAGAPTNEDLLVAVGQARSRDAFIRLFEHYAPRIKSFLMKGGTPADAADELAQETMLTVWQRAATYDPAKAAAGTWIYTIARNKRIDAARRQGARGGNPVDVDALYFMPDPDTPLPDAAIAAAQETQIVSAAMAALPPEQAEMLHKSFFENKSHSTIAAETGLPVGTVKSRIRLAMDRLRARLQDGGPDGR